VGPGDRLQPVVAWAMVDHRLHRLGHRQLLPSFWDGYPASVGSRPVSPRWFDTKNLSDQHLNRFNRVSEYGPDLCACQVVQPLIFSGRGGGQQPFFIVLCGPSCVCFAEVVDRSATSRILQAGSHSEWKSEGAQQPGSE
jgi:hypothetical protein